MPRSHDDDGPDEASRRRRRVRGVAGVVLVAVSVGAVVVWQRTHGPDVDAFCTHLTGAVALDDRLATDPADLATELEGLRAAAEVAPPEVADDVDVLVDALTRLEAAARRDPSDPQGGVQDELRSMQGDVDQLEAAAQAVGAYADDTCGLALPGTRTTGTSRPPGTAVTGADTPATAP